MRRLLGSRAVSIISLLVIVGLAAVAVSLMTSDAGGDNDDGPLARWTFDEGAGSVAMSTAESSTPVALEVVGEPVWSDGAISVGSSSFLLSEGAVTALADAIATSRELTFELWFDPYRLDQGQQSTIVSLTDGRSGDLRLLANPEEGDSGVLEARIRSALTDQEGRPGATSASGDLTDPLTHVVIVHAGRTVELWIDGELVSQEQVGPIVGPSAAARLSFGAALDSSTPFAADIHEASFYAYALTPGQVQSNLEAGPAGTENPGTVDVTVTTSEDTDVSTTSDIAVDDDVEEVVAGIVFTGLDGNATVEVWHGVQGPFGVLGRPQPLLNVIGTAADPEGVREIRYGLPGAEPVTAGLGPNDRRLVSARSFNLEIPDASVGSGGSLDIVVVDNTGDETTVRVPLEDLDTAAPSLPLTVDWTEAGLVDELADVIDGRWRIAGTDVVADEIGYDRLLAIGDTSWTDYEVLVPITVNDVADVVGPFSNSPGIGVIMRWNGHNRLGNEEAQQPLEGFRAAVDQPTPFGAIGWFRFGGSGGRLQLVDHRNTVRGTDPGQFPLGVQHWLRAAVVTEADGRSVYQLKVWKAGTREPDEWQLEFTSTNDGSEPAAGSLLLVAHEVGAQFGRVTVTAPGAGTLVGAEPTSDAIAEWSFDDGFGPTVADITGNGVDLGVPGGAAWVDGGLQLDGTGGAISGVSATGFESVEETGELTVEIWADPAGLDQTTLARLVSIQGSAGAFDLGVSPLTGAFDEAEVRVRTEETDFLGRPGVTVSGALDEDLAHIVVTHAGTTTEIRVDGELLVSNASGRIDGWPPDARVAIGSTPAGSAGWNGTVLHAAIWDRALDPTEIEARFAAGPGVAPG